MMSLDQLLVREPYRFDSGQAVRILSARDAEGKPIFAGPVQFRSSFSLTFPTSDVETVAIPESSPPEMIVSFLGLGGALGPLPIRYTEFVNDGVRRDETAARDFLDIFNGRLVESALELQRVFRPVLQDGPAHGSNLAGQLYALAGLGTPEITAAIPKLTPQLLALTALIHQRPISAHAVERAVSLNFGVQARVRQFCGAWLEIPEEQRTKIGVGGQCQRLGCDAVLGRRAWDPSAGIELILGPAPYERVLALLPDAPDHAALAALIDFLLDGRFDVTVRMVVERSAVPASTLPVTRPATPGAGTDARAAELRRHPMQLGWTAWLRSGTRLGEGEAAPGAGATPTPVLVSQSRFRLTPSGPRAAPLATAHK